MRQHVGKRLADRGLLGRGGGRDRAQRVAGGHALQRQRELGERDAVVCVDRVPQAQQAVVQVEREDMVASLDGIPQLDGRARHGRRQHRDHAMRAQRHAGVQQRIDGGEDAVLGARADQQVGQRLQVARTLLDADDAGHLAHDAQQQRRRHVVPGDHVVDQHRDIDRVGDFAEVLDHRIVVALVDVVRGRDLQCRDTHAAQCLGATDRIARAVGDDAGHQRHGAVDFFCGHGRDAL